MALGWTWGAARLVNPDNEEMFANQADRMFPSVEIVVTTGQDYWRCLGTPRNPVRAHEVESMPPPPPSNHQPLPEILG